MNSVSTEKAQWQIQQHTEKFPKETPLTNVDDDLTFATVVTTASSATATSIGSVSPRKDELRHANDVVAATFQPTTIRIDETILLQIRSDAIDAIIQCYNQVVGGGSGSLSSSLMDPPVAIGVGTPAVRNSIPTSGMTMTSCSINTADCVTHKIAISAAAAAATATLNNKKNSIASASPSPFLLVTGPTGSGKTKLIQYALQEKTRKQGGYFIRGKFDVLQHPDPYRTYSTAFTDFTYQVVQRGPDVVRAMRDAIRTACGGETCVLVQMIPALSAILCYHDDDRANGITATQGDVPTSNSFGKPSHPNSDDIIQRFVFVFQMFLRAISCIEQPIVLILDDLQWSDPCSIDLMCSIVTDLGNTPGLLVVGTYDNDYNTNVSDVAMGKTVVTTPTTTWSNRYLVQKLNEMERNNELVVQTVLIQNLDYPAVKRLLVAALTPRSLLELQVDDVLCNIVMDQTNGNLFLLFEFLKWLHDTGLIMAPDPQQGIGTLWTWSTNDIQSAVMCHSKDSENNSSRYYVLDILGRIPREMIDVLEVCACLGCSHMEDTLIEYVLDYPVSAMLLEAVEMGILHTLDYDVGGPEEKMYAFEHDSIQMAAYNLIPEANRELFHLEIGRRLWRRLSSTVLDQYIFVVLSQMIVGQRLITRSSERYSVASLCLHAGRKAAKSSTFRVALIYLKFGIELLGDSGWRDEYDLSLTLNNAAAEMEMCAANFEGMELVIESIICHARCSDDKIQARTTQFYALCVSDRQQMGLDLAIQLLSDLGTPMPRRICKFTLRNELQSVRKKLKGKSNEYLKRLPMIKDGNVLASLQIFNLVGCIGFPNYFFKRPHM
jgi:predicted ATPase